MNVLLCWGPHSSFPYLLSTLKKGKLLLADFDMNPFSTAILPMRFWTSFLYLGSSITQIVFILSRFVFTPWWTQDNPILSLSRLRKHTFLDSVLSSLHRAYRRSLWDLGCDPLFQHFSWWCHQCMLVCFYQYEIFNTSPAMRVNIGSAFLSPLAFGQNNMFRMRWWNWFSLRRAFSHPHLVITWETIEWHSCCSCCHISHFVNSR